MVRQFQGLLALARSVVIGIVFVFGLSVQAGQAQAAGGSMTVSAVVTPVRYILVDDQYTIRQILSNSPSDTTPIVYKDSFGSTPLAMTPEIKRQYLAIMHHTNVQRTGVIYPIMQTAAKKPASPVGWFRQVSILLI